MPSEDPTIFVLFGATGDLAKRMVLPAFFELHTRGLMPETWRMVGNGRGDVSHLDFRGHVKEVLDEFGPKYTAEQWDAFVEHLFFAGGGFEKSNPGSLLDVLQEAHDDLGPDARYIHYLAIPPSAFIKITEGLDEHDLIRDDSRVVYEKPYGNSLASFHELDDLVQSVMKEEQVYRIDHFLGKEATQNIHVLRFANALFANIWCKEYVTQVQIDVPETLDVADRAGFYDETGAFKDMIATHLFQVAAEVAMEPPASMRAEDLQDARESVLAAFRPLEADDVVFGQYEGYRELPDVPDDSQTDTMAAVRLWVDTDRWRGVPFVLRSGKQMAVSQQKVILVVRTPQGPLTHVPASTIELSLKGTGEMQVQLVLKKPGPDLDLVEQRIDLKLDNGTDSSGLPPYVALLHDVTLGDRSLFTSSAGLERAWTAAAPVVDHPPAPVPYRPGSWGPSESVRLTGDVGWVLQDAADGS
ncbi:glucose-6-phosphate 1-dehydrogenase [Friedmanniella endophytica]|uniref:Glucose-6-phosphate 1-dehydrogenase n=1 Tax=Microlunatus kandeliicorticis TaxID=1759536 RepID=A0A7W3P5Y2_9ACTN|nr:glucose-6-phosphate dehydrogenase [Microlunatus kandeliicorticis]MBA8794476.1 glucose-6-phosphate 1-dehydrogenase [Microlunatus kandeliicorticis]